MTLKDTKHLRPGNKVRIRRPNEPPRDVVIGGLSYRGKKLRITTVDGPEVECFAEEMEVLR